MNPLYFELKCQGYTYYVIQGLKQGAIVGGISNNLKAFTFSLETRANGPRIVVIF